MVPETRLSDGCARLFRVTEAAYNRMIDRGAASPTRDEDVSERLMAGLVLALIGRVANRPRPSSAHHTFSSVNMPSSSWEAAERN